MCNFFASTGNKNLQNKTCWRSVFDNILHIVFGCIFMADLWDINKRNPCDID
jgi:hypothetical protein